MATDYSYRGLYHSSPLPSCALTRADIRKLYRELDQRTREAATRQLDLVRRPSTMSEEDFQRSKADMLSRSGLTVTVLGSQGEQVVGTSEQALEDNNLPDGITEISFDSAHAYRAAMNDNPLDRFNIRFDFAESPGYGKYNPWDEDTPNNSRLEVIGPTDTWATAVYENTLAFLRRRGRRRSWLHSSVTFNVANYLIGFPLAFWIVYRLDQQFSAVFQRLPGVLRGAVYVYLVLMGLLVFRISFALLRWIFPVVELEGATSKAVRAAVGAFLAAIVSSLAYDILKTLVGT